MILAYLFGPDSSVFQPRMQCLGGHARCGTQSSTCKASKPFNPLSLSLAPRTVHLNMNHFPALDRATHFRLLKPTHWNLNGPTTCFPNYPVGQQLSPSLLSVCFPSILSVQVLIRLGPLKSQTNFWTCYLTLAQLASLCLNDNIIHSCIEPDSATKGPVYLKKKKRPLSNNDSFS